MQNIVTWHFDQFQTTHIWNPWSNETDANSEDSACKVQVLLFFPIVNFKAQSKAKFLLESNFWKYIITLLMLFPTLLWTCKSHQCRSYGNVNTLSYLLHVSQSAQNSNSAWVRGFKSFFLGKIGLYLAVFVSKKTCFVTFYC